MKPRGRPRAVTLEPIPEGSPCPHCTRRFPKDAYHYYRNKTRADGLDWCCKDCRREIRNKWYSEHREETRLSTQTPKGRYLKIRNNARQRGYGWTLSPEEFGQLWQLPCHYCGSPIETVGIDRVNSTHGYEVGNVVPCCGMCNLMKNEHSVDDWVAHMRKILSHLGSALTPSDVSGV